MKIKNKKGMEKILGVYWFVILTLVAGAIVFMVSSFYGDPYDVRELEANIMINNIANCITEPESGQLREIDEEFRNNFLEECNLNFKTNDEGQYYVKIEFLDFDTRDPAYSLIEKGNINLKNNPNKNSLVSSEKPFYVLRNNQEVIVKITSIINKEKQNAG